MVYNKGHVRGPVRRCERVDACVRGPVRRCKKV